MIVMPVKKIDIKYILITIGLILSFVLSYCYKQEIITIINIFFSWAYLNIVAGSVAAGVTIGHKLKHRKISFKSSMSFSEFNTPFSELFSFILNPVTLVCSLSIAKFLFFHIINSDTTFNNFSGTELTFIAVVTAYLLFSSINELFRDIKEIWYQITIVIETPKAIENDNSEIPNPEIN